MINEGYQEDYLDSMLEMEEMKLRKFKKTFGDELTVHIPISPRYSFSRLQKYIPNGIVQKNEIIENEKFFIVNGKEFKKISFLRSLLYHESISNATSKMLSEQDTTGDLFLTFDHYWFARCSDYDMVSWNSCFSSSGCNSHCPFEYATSMHMFMAMILNSDKTKIIGRKFVIISPETNQIFFLRRYGTFPIEYQQELSRFIIREIFEDSKTEYCVIDAENEKRSFEGYVSIDGGDGYGNWDRDNSDGRIIWIDNTEFILAKSRTPKSFRVTFDNSVMEKTQVYCWQCDDYMSEREADLLTCIVDPDGGEEDVCLHCRKNYYRYSSYLDQYINEDCTKVVIRINPDGTYDGEVLVWENFETDIVAEEIDYNETWEIIIEGKRPPALNEKDEFFMNDLIEGTSERMDKYLSEQGDDE